MIPKIILVGYRFIRFYRNISFTRNDRRNPKGELNSIVEPVVSIFRFECGRGWSGRGFSSVCFRGQLRWGDVCVCHMSPKLKVKQQTAPASVRIGVGRVQTLPTQAQNNTPCGFGRSYTPTSPSSPRKRSCHERDWLPSNDGHSCSWQLSHQRWRF